MNKGNMQAVPISEAAKNIGNSPGQPRWNYLDQLRVALMLFGIPYHTALAYAFHNPWIINSPDESSLLTWMAQFSHTFRMPAFFLLSGFFAVLLIRRQDAAKWWKSRLVRLGVPLIATALLVNPLMMLAHSVAEAEPGNILADWYLQMGSYGEHWIVHLWFLIHLLVYSALLAGLWHWRAPLRLEERVSAFQDFLERKPVCFWPLLLLVGTATLGFSVVAKVGGFSYILNGMLMPGKLAADLPVFLFGGLLAYRIEWLARFTQPRASFWVAAFLTASVLAVFQTSDTAISRVVTYFLMPIVGILFSHVLLSAARRWMDRPSAIGASLSEAAMTIYLVHIAIICWLAGFFLEISLNPLLEFAIISALTFAVSYGFHLAIRRNPVLLYLFNGRTSIQRRGKEQPKPAPVIAGPQAIGQ